MQESVTNTLQKSQENLPDYNKGEPIQFGMLTLNWARNKYPTIETTAQAVALARTEGVYIPSVQRAIKEMGQVKVAAAIKIMLIEINALLNLPRPLTEIMIDAIAPMVVKRIASYDITLNMADLNIIMQRAIEGKWGNYYGGIGASDIIGWFDSYIMEKDEAIERWHHDQYHEDRRDSIIDHRANERNKNHQAYLQHVSDKMKEKAI